MLFKFDWRFDFPGQRGGYAIEIYYWVAFSNSGRQLSGRFVCLLRVDPRRFLFPWVMKSNRKPKDGQRWACVVRIRPFDYPNFNKGQVDRSGLVAFTAQFYRMAKSNPLVLFRKARSFILSISYTRRLSTSGNLHYTIDSNHVANKRIFLLTIVGHLGPNMSTRICPRSPTVYVHSELVNFGEQGKYYRCVYQLPKAETHPNKLLCCQHNWTKVERHSVRHILFLSLLPRVASRSHSFGVIRELYSKIQVNKGLHV